jgi:hypothetical protein
MLRRLGPRVARKFWDSRIAAGKYSPSTRDVALLYYGIRDQAASNDLALDLIIHAVWAHGGYLAMRIDRQIVAHLRKLIL